MPDSGSPTLDAAAHEKAGGIAAARKRRRNLLALLGAVVVVGFVVWLAYWLLISSHYVVTDNAYVGANTAEVSPLVSGQVAQVMVVETQNVQAGDPVVILDDADAKIALAGAEAALSQAKRQVQGYFANDTALGARSMRGQRTSPGRTRNWQAPRPTSNAPTQT